MAKYRKKPVIVDATQWFENGDHPEDNCGPNKRTETAPYAGQGEVVGYYVIPIYILARGKCIKCGKTHYNHGELRCNHNRVCPGDWIITLKGGERYTCKPDIFEQTYEKV